MKPYLLFVVVIVGLAGLTACAALDYNPYADLNPTPSSTPAPTVTAFVGSTPTEPPITPTTPPILCTVIVSESLNFRTGPGTSYVVIDWLKPGDVLEVTQQRDGWANVRTADGVVGWVNQSYCR